MHTVQNIFLVPNKNVFIFTILKYCLRLDFLPRAHLNQFVTAQYYARAYHRYNNGSRLRLPKPNLCHSYCPVVDQSVCLVLQYHQCR